MLLWPSRNRWMLAHAARMTIAGVSALGLVYALGLSVELSAVITAVMVTQSNVGGSLKMAFEQFLGSLLGAAFATGVAFTITPDDALTYAVALAITLAPLAIVASLSPGYRIALITAAVVLLGRPGIDMNPLDLAVARIFGVGLGCAVGMLVAVAIMPARASRSVGKTAAEVTRMMADQLDLLASGSATIQTDLGTLAGEIRENLSQLSALVGEAAQERRAGLSAFPDGQRLLRTLRRIRHDVDMLRRTSRGAGDDVLHEYVAQHWQWAAETGASTLRSVGRVLDGQPAPADVNMLAPAVREYRAAVEHMRKAGMTQSLSTDALSRLFGMGFTLEQLRRDLDDFIDISKEFTGERVRAAE